MAATLKLDDLRPANTFERRLLQFLVEGGTLPISVEHVGQEDLSAMQARVDALAEMVARPQIIPVSDQTQADLTPVLGEIDRIKGTHSELLRLVQKLAKDADALKNENVTLWKAIDCLMSQATWVGLAKDAG